MIDYQCNKGDEKNVLKKYSKTFALMLLLLLPSAVLTNNIAVGLPEFINGEDLSMTFQNIHQQNFGRE